MTTITLPAITLPAITLQDLYKNQYTMAELATNIKHLPIKNILHTQKLTSDFCADYILDEYYMTCNEDFYLINYRYVLYYQSHISEDELVDSLLIYEPKHKGCQPG